MTGEYDSAIISCVVRTIHTPGPDGPGVSEYRVRAVYTRRRRSMGYKNMIFDVMILNMERQLVELAHERFGKPREACSDEET